MHGLTQDSVVAIQFEDIVTQMMSRISQRTTNVGDYMHAFLALQHDKEANGLQRFRTRSEKLVQLLVSSHTRSDAIKASAAVAHAKARTNGEVELF